MIRSQEEILDRIKKSNDLFGTQKLDLVQYLDFEHAKPFIKDEFVEAIEKGTDTWEPATNPKKEIVEYLDFAYEKAENQRGLSAGRSMLHFKTWIWLDDDKFYNEILSDINNYGNYGIDVLDRISEKYGFERAQPAEDYFSE